jgi:hypothetical protein
MTLWVRSDVFAALAQVRCYPNNDRDSAAEEMRKGAYAIALWSCQFQRWPDQFHSER